MITRRQLLQGAAAAVAVTGASIAALAIPENSPVWAEESTTELLPTTGGVCGVWDDCVIRTSANPFNQRPVSVRVQRWVSRESLEDGQWDHVKWTWSSGRTDDMVLIEYTQ